MANQNVNLIGQLLEDPEFEVWENNFKVAFFPLMTEETILEDGTVVKELTRHHIVIWCDPGNTVPAYLKKGAFIYVDGKLHTRQKTQGEDSSYITELVARSYFLLQKVSTF